MKREKRTQRSLKLTKFLALSLGIPLAGFSPINSPLAHAASLTWDADATFNNGTFGGTGTWDTSTANWANGTVDAAWTNSLNDTAVFAGTAGTVTVGGSLNAGGLQFATTGYSLSGGTITLDAGGINAGALSSGTISISSGIVLNANQSWAIGTGATLLSSGIISGANGLTLGGGGTFTLIGANTYSGPTAISGATVDIGGGTANGSLSSSSAVSLSGGSTLKYTVTGGGTQTFNGTAITGGANAINTVAGNTLALGTLTQTAGSNGTVVFGNTGTISTTTADTNGILGGWAVVQTGATTYGWAHSGSAGTNNITAATLSTLGTSVSSGTTSAGVNWSNTDGVATVTANTTVNSLSQWQDVTINSGVTLTIASGGIILGDNGSKWTKTGSGTATVTSGLASGELFFHTPNTSASDNQFQVTIADNGSTPVSVTKDGPGMVAFTKANTYTGNTYINGGTFAAGVTGAIGTSGTLYLNNATLNDYAAGANVTFANSIVVSGNSFINLGTTKNLSVTGTISGSGFLTLGNNGSNSSVYLTGANAMSSGTVSLANNTNAVRFGVANAGNANVAWVFNNTGSNKDTLDFSNGTISFGSMSGSGVLQGNGSTNDTISVGGLNANATFNGIIHNGSGAFNLTKVGTGSQTMAGTSDYTGITTVQNGSLIAGANALASASGPFGNSSAAIALGDATSISSNFSPSLMIGGAFTIGRPVTVGATTDPTSGTYTIGGNTANNSTVSGALTLNQSLTLSQVASGTLNVSGVVSGVGGLNKSGAGTVTLSAVNTYSGATNVANGTLKLTTGEINGSSGITVNGSGAKFIQNSTTAVSPAVTLSQGTVDGTGTINSLTVANSASNVLQNGDGGTATLTLGSLTFNGAAAVNILDGGISTTPGINVTGALTTTSANGLVTINASAASWSAGTYDLIGFGSFGGSLSDFVKGTVTGLNIRQSATLGLDAVNKFVTLNIAGDTPRWTGLDGSSWVVGSTGANSNWQLVTSATATDYIAGDSVLFDDTATGTTNIDISSANVSPATVTFNNNSAFYTVSSSGGFGIASGLVTKNGSGTVILATANSYSGGTNINNGVLALSGTGTLGATTGAVAMGGGTLDLGATSQTVGAVTISARAASGDTIQNGTLTPASVTATHNSGNAIISASLAGSGAVTMNGAGTLTLTGQNTYTGGTLVKSGTVAIGVGGSLASTATITLGDATANTSGVFQLGDANGPANATIASLGIAGSGTGNMVVGGNGAVSTLTLNHSTALTYNGSFGGSDVNQNNLALVKAGAGTLTLTGSSSYGGGTTVNAGKLLVGNGAALGTGDVTLNDGATLSNSAGVTTANNLVINGAVTLDSNVGNWNLNGNLSGTGSITRGTSATNSIYLGSSDNSNFTGTFTIPANGNAVVRFSNPGAGSANAKWVFNQNTDTRTSFDFSNGTIRFGSLTGSGFITNQGSGTNTIEVGNLGLDETFSGVFDQGGSTTLAITKVGSGTWTLTGSNSYTGVTTINGGTLQIGNGTIDGSILRTSGITNNGTLAYNLKGAQSYTQAITGSGSVTKSGTGTLTLSGNSTYTGDTIVNAGKLIVSGSSSGTANISVAAGAKLDIDGGFLSPGSTTTVSGILQGGGDGVNTGLVGVVSVNSGGTLAPGKQTSTSTAGTLTAAGNVGFADSTSIFSIRLGVGTASDNDKLAISGFDLVGLNGATLQLTLGANYSRQVDGFTYVLIDGGSSAFISGTFAQNNIITDSLGDQFTILYGVDATGTTAGNDVVLQLLAVPEPQTWAMLAGGFGMLAFSSRLRRRK
jgi:autotransporter-associated beta strand protein